MIQKSQTTLIHLARSRELTDVMRRIDSMNLDVISVDYDNKRIEITRPANTRKVSEFPPLRGENSVTRIEMSGFIVYWANQPQPQEMSYVRA